MHYISCSGAELARCREANLEVEGIDIEMHSSG